MPLPVIAGLILLPILVWLIWQAPPSKSMAEEERELREYFCKRDAAERRGEIWPPRVGGS